MGLFRGAVFDHGGVPANCLLALMGRFPSLMGRFPSSMARLPERLNGPFSLFSGREFSHVIVSVRMAATFLYEGIS